MSEVLRDLAVRNKLLGLAFFFFLEVLPSFSQTPAAISYYQVGKHEIEARLKRVTSKNEDRQRHLKTLFEEANCREERLLEQQVKASRTPNVICELPGTSGSVLIVGAHFG